MKNGDTLQYCHCCHFACSEAQQKCGFKILLTVLTAASYHGTTPCKWLTTPMQNVYPTAEHPKSCLRIRGGSVTARDKACPLLPLTTARQRAPATKNSDAIPSLAGGSAGHPSAGTTAPLTAFAWARNGLLNQSKQGLFH